MCARRNRLASALAVVIWLAIAPAWAGAEAARPPAESMAKLENIFAAVADGLWTASDEAWHVGRHDVSIELCRMIVEIDPAFADAYSVGALLLASAERDAEAVAMYERAIAALPGQYAPRFDLGMHYYGQKEYAKAEKQFSEAVKASAPAHVWKMLAHSREKLGRLPDALAAWDKVRELTPSDPVIESNVKRLEGKLSGGTGAH